MSPTEVLEELQCHVRPNLPNTLRIVPKKILETLAEIEVALTKYYETIQQGEGGYLSVVYGEQVSFQLLFIIYFIIFFSFSLILFCFLFFSFFSCEIDSFFFWFWTS